MAKEILQEPQVFYDQEKSELIITPVPKGNMYCIWLRDLKGKFLCSDNRFPANRLRIKLRLLKIQGVDELEPGRYLVTVMAQDNCKGECGENVSPWVHKLVELSAENIRELGLRVKSVVKIDSELLPATQHTTHTGTNRGRIEIGAGSRWPKAGITSHAD